jgi:uncharacterized protein DUF2442
MTYLPLVVAAEYDAEYRVHLQFNDGCSKLVDLRPLLIGPVFDPITAESEFRGFFIDAGTLSWPCGADLAPEALYALPNVETKVSAGVESPTTTCRL